MSDEFADEADSNTPTAADLEEAYGSRFLGVVDIGDKKIRTKIVRVTKDEVKARNSNRVNKRFLVFFENIKKALVLNPTNKTTLVDAFGKDPGVWKGVTVGIYVDPTVMFEGKRTGGVRLRSLQPPAPAAKPVPKLAPAQTAKPATTAWPEQPGDPGPDFDQANFEPAA